MAVATKVDEYGEVTGRYYDAVYARLRGEAGDVEFYRALAREAQGPVLELGCGTGRVLLPIAELGIPCTGLDASPRMLAELRRKAFPPTLRLVSAPMQRFDLGRDRFSLIYSAFRAFQHLHSVEDQLACLACVRAHLTPEGRFAFDVFNPRLERMAIASEPEHEEARFELAGEEIVRFVAVERDRAAQQMRVRFRYERRSEGGVLGSEVVEVQMRYFFRFELEHLLARAGFREVAIYGGFDRRPFADGCPEQIVVAR